MKKRGIRITQHASRNTQQKARNSLILILLSILSSTFFYACFRPDFSEMLELVEKGEYSRAASQIEQRLPKEDRDLQYQMYYVLGKCYSAMKQWNKAAESYRQSIDPTNEISDYAAYHVAQCYENMEDYENAVYWYEQLIEKYPDSFKPTTSVGGAAMYHLSKCYLHLKKYRAALDIDEQLIAKNAKGYIRLANFNSAKAYEGLEQWAEAKIFYQKIIDANQSDWIARDALSEIQRLVAVHKELKISRSQYFTHGMVMYKAGKYQTARKLLEKVRRNYKDNLAVKSAYYIAESYYRQRKYSRAIDEYRRLVKNYPTNPYRTTSLYQIARCYQRKDHLTQAAKLYKEFAGQYSWSKFTDNALYNRAGILRVQNKYLGAIETYELLTRKYTRSGFADDALWWKGWCQFSLHKYDESIATFKSLTSRFPHSGYASRANFWIGKNYEAMKRWEDASAIYKKIIDENAWYYSVQAEERVRFLSENGKIAVGTDRQHFRVQPSVDEDLWDDFPKFVTSKIDLLMKLKAFDDAIVELEKIRKKQEIDRKSVYYNLAVCNKKRGNYRKAYSHVNILSKILPNETSDKLNPIEVYKLLYPLHFKELIYKYSEKHEIDPLFIAAMIREESKFDAKVISWANAYGLMQIIPSTGQNVAPKIGIKNFKTSMLKQPEINIRIGVWYTKWIFDQLNNYALVAGAYNCGPARVERWVKDRGVNDLDEFVENVPIYQTRNHIKKVMDTYQIYKELYGKM